MNDQPNKKSRALNFFEEGKKFTEELLKENEQLRLVIAKLKTEKRDAAYKAVDADSPYLEDKFKLIEEENKRLKEENEELRDQFTYVEDENREFAERYVQVERQNSDLISLYVASYQLHSTLDYDEVVGAVKEIVINLVGAEEFGIYLLEEESNKLHLIASEGDEKFNKTPIDMGEGPIGEAAKTGNVYIDESAKGGEVNETGKPIACIPLKIGDHVTGVVSIYELLLQKHGFEALDYELFELLGNHAATALYGARLYMVSERKRNTLEGFLELIKADMKPKM